MLPHTYELPVALLLVLGGALSCFAGYRFFRIVLAINGFIAGAALASSTMAPSNTVGLVAAALIGGIVGALILVLAYFVGVALAGAALGALVIHLVWSRVGTGDPPWPAVIVIAIFGAVAAMVLQRYVIVVATAFGGAWMLIVGGVAMANGEQAAAAGAVQNVRAADVWILYPFTPDPSRRWLPAAWLALGLVGMAVQLVTTGGRRRKK